MELSLWENLLMGVMVVGVILWMRPGIKASMQQTREAKSDWMSVLIPIGFVVIFIVFLIAMV
jgi:TRAP-type C4-dicarboxylate transport system permease small subunit